MRYLIAPLTLSIAAAATPGFAELSEGNFTISGYFEETFLSETDDLPVDLGVFSGDVKLGYAFTDTIGVELDLAVAEVGLSIWAVNPVVYYEASFGKFSLGMPVSVYDKGYRDDRSTLSSSLNRMAGDLMMMSNSRIINLGSGTSGAPEYYPVGLRYDGTFGDLSVGASVLWTDIDDTGVYDISLAARYEISSLEMFDSFAVYAAADFITVPDNDYDASQFLLGVEAEMGKWGFGLSYTSALLLGGYSTDENFDSMTAYVDYDITDKLTVDAALTAIDLGEAATFYSIGANYALTDNIYAKAAYFDNDRDELAPLGNLFELTVGVKF